MITCTLQTITPAMASDWLTNNSRNRPKSTGEQEKIAKDIRAGHWRVTGDTIKRNCNGEILDGQTRLAAIAMSGVPVQTLVVEGLEFESVFAYLDQHRKRSLGDMIALRGGKDAKAAASITKALFSYEKHGVPVSGWCGIVALHTFVEFWERNHEEITDAAEASQRASDDLKLIGMPPSIYGGCWCIFGRIDAEARDDFMGRLRRGNSLSTTSVIYLLRKRLMENRDRNSIKMSREAIAALVILAWNHYRLGNTPSKLIWQPERMDFPIPA